MDAVEIKTGLADVVASGTVIAFKGGPIEISYGPVAERLKVIFTFQNETPPGQARFEGKVIDPKTLEFILFNFNNPLGLGPQQPLEIGVLSNRRLYVQFKVFQSTVEDKTLQYTFYCGEVVGK